MTQITLENYAAVGVENLDTLFDPSYTVRFHVMQWNAEIADVVVNASATVATSLSATVRAIAMNESNTVAEKSISLEAADIAITGSGDTFQLQTSAATTAETLTLKNQCSFAVMFELVPSTTPAQSYTLAPNEELQITLATQFTAYAKIHDYPGEPVGSDGFDTPTVGFSSASARVAIVADSSKGNKYHLTVS